ncbi:hypothetical protein HPB52_020103 [Rhipicephalus sanguineus]|uniref:CCHC-type domain-containing protein n=1 Tax=Rhipicephalus sanguineus TaxID=34632 RepID=A0A9D4Q884_RHISA|nr:hypothetical protein HPB52_020103 [Rhipicephalus sanguineus]
MQERLQQHNESTTTYFHYKVRLCHDVNLELNDTREQVLTGRRYRELCTMLLGRAHDADDDLLHDMLEFERIELARWEIFGSRIRSLVSSPSSECSLPMTKELTIDASQGTDRRQGLPPVSQHGERRCYNCNVCGHIARNCKSFARNESNVVGEELPCTGADHVLLKEIIFNDDFALVGLTDPCSPGCLLRASAAARCGIEMAQEATHLYGFHNKYVPVTRSLGHCKAKISFDGVVAEKIPVLVVPDDAQCVDLLVGRNFTELPNVTYAKRHWHSSLR